MDTIWVAAITGASTIAASAIATFLAQRHSVKIADLGMREQRRRDVRALLVELHEAGRIWWTTMEIFVPVLWNVGTGWQKMVTEYTETDSGVALGNANKNIQRILGELLLSVDDSKLLGLLDDLQLLRDGAATETTGRLINGSKATRGRASEADLDKVVLFVATNKSVFEKIQARGAELIRGSL